MMDNTININVATGEVTHIYTEPIIINEEIVIDYDAEVHRLIREKYTQSQEFAILRQKEEKPDEFQEYFVFCEECKLKAKNLT